MIINQTYVIINNIKRFFYPCLSKKEYLELCLIIKNIESDKLSLYILEYLYIRYKRTNLFDERINTLKDQLPFCTTITDKIFLLDMICSIYEEIFFKYT